MNWPAIPRLRFVDQGVGPATLILIHELGGSLASWDGVVAALAPSWRRLAYDQRGQGGSQKVRDAFGLDAHVDDLARLLDDRDVARPCWLVGAAAGAAIAVDFALRWPRRVAGIVMCAPAIDAPPDRRAALRERAEVAEHDGMRAVVDAALERSWPPTLRDDPAALTRFERYREGMLGNDPVAYAFAARALADAGSDERVRELRCACLVLAGTHDSQRPAAALAIQAGKIPGARFEALVAGHLMAVQAPTAVAQRLEAFVNEVEA